MAQKRSTGTRVRQRGVELIHFNHDDEIIILLRLRRKYGKHRLTQLATDDCTIILPVRRESK